MKKVLSVVFSLILVSVLSVPAFAEPGAQYTYVWDFADVMSESQEQMLDEQLSEIDLAYASPLYIISKYGNADYTATEYAKMFVANSGELFRSYGEDIGFVFVDDFDNDTYLFYIVGDGDLIVDSSELQAIYDYLDRAYDIDNPFAAYSSVAAFVNQYCQGFFDNDSGESTTASDYGDGYDYSAPDSNGKQIADDAGLLTDEQEATLLKSIEVIREKYSFDVVLHTTNSIGEKTVSDYADDYYDYNGYGVGENRDGLLFMLNMNNGEEGNRDYYTSTCGSGITAFTDYAIKDSNSKINSLILPFLEDGDWFGAFEKYLELVDIFLEQAQTGEPYDSSNPYKTFSDYVIMEGIVLAVAALAVFIVSKKLGSSMKTNVKKAGATDYVNPGSFKLTGSCDVFLNKTITRTAKPKETKSGSGSSTHTSSSGSTHGGGGGKF